MPFAEFPKDSNSPRMTEHVQILQRRLECFSRDLKVPWIALKSVFNIFGRKSSLGALIVMVMSWFTRASEKKS